MIGTWLWPKLNSRQVIGSRPRTTTSTPNIISECPRIEERHNGQLVTASALSYGITGTPNGDIWFVSLAGSYLANVDLETGAVTVYEPPTKDQGARHVWSDSKGRLWISEWNSGNVSVYDPTDKSWKQWKLPGEKPRTYAVWVDPDDKVWLSEWAANAIVRFDPASEKFESF